MSLRHEQWRKELTSLPEVLKTALRLAQAGYLDYLVHRTTWYIGVDCFSGCPLQHVQNIRRCPSCGQIRLGLRSVAGMMGG